MIDGYSLEGHALVSANDCIADVDGQTPPQLRHEEDWRRFQTALDAAAIVVVGRLSHEANPNVRQRRRLILSSSAAGLERREDGWWWNPATMPLEAALALAAPDGGTVAVPGGRLVFDYFLGVGFDAFHLSRLPAVSLPGGVPVFSACANGTAAATVLRHAGLVPAAAERAGQRGELVIERWRMAGGRAS